MVMLDSQTVKGGRSGPCFHETGGKFGATFGAKRTVLVDYLGLPVAARVDSARPHDSKAGRWLCDAALPHLPRVKDVLADAGFMPLVAAVGRQHKVKVTIKTWTPKRKGFKPMQPVWRVENCFAQLGRYRRLSRSFEGSVESADAWLHVACVGYTLSRLT
jgi:putative transposase